MLGFASQYDPEGTPTFDFFGSPIANAPESPVTRLLRDVGNVLLKSRLIVAVLRAFWTERPVDELYLWATTVFSLAWFTVWSLFQFPVVGALVVVFVAAATVLSALTSLQDLAVWRVVQGPILQVYPPEPPPKHNPRERWVYLNGVATGKTIVRQNLELLARTFHNPVLAVNNRTYGFMGDILECIVQRALGYHSPETGVAYGIIRSYLEDDARVDKVVLIAHSQGGIMASQIVDQLLSEVSPDHMSKLEVYTFGNAALKFNNPWRDRQRTARVIPVIEHYCNERDMVTSWGALSSVDREDLPFVGKVFVFEGQSGHLLNQHYLKHMFTGPQHTWAKDNFQSRAVELDAHTTDKYYVTGRRADPGRGEVSVQGLSELWKYMC